MGAKSDTCFRLRGFGFAHASAAFLDENRSVARGWRWDYGEDGNWEQAKPCPTGAAGPLLRILDKAPEQALRVLT